MCEPFSYLPLVHGQCRRRAGSPACGTLASTLLKHKRGNGAIGVLNELSLQFVYLWHKRGLLVCIPLAPAGAGASRAGARPRSRGGQLAARKPPAPPALTAQPLLHRKDAAARQLAGEWDEDLEQRWQSSFWHRLSSPCRRRQAQKR